MGVSSPDLYQSQVLHINVYKKVLGVLHHLLAMRPADIMILSFLITVSQPETYFPGVTFLKPGTTL